MVRFGDREISKERFYAARRPIRIWDVNVDDIVISKLVKAKINFKYLIVYLDKVVRPLVLIMPKISGYVKTFKIEEGNNELMSFHTNDEKLLEKYKAILTKIVDLKNIKLHTLPVYDDRYIKTKLKRFNDKVYTNFLGLNVPEDDIEFESFTVISIDSFLVEGKKYYLQVYLDNFVYKL